jgi:hypothetical protein
VVLMSQAVNAGDPRAVDRFVAEITRVAGLDEKGNYILDTLYRGVEGFNIDLYTKAWKEIGGGSGEKK